MSGRDGGTGEGDFLARLMADQRRTWDERHGDTPATSDADPASTSASEVEGLDRDEWCICSTEFRAEHGDAHTRICSQQWADLARLIAAREAAAANRGRAEAREERFSRSEIERALREADVPEDSMATDDDTPYYEGRAEAVAIFRDMLGLGESARADSLDPAPRGDGEGA